MTEACQGWLPANGQYTDIQLAGVLTSSSSISLSMCSSPPVCEDTSISSTLGVASSISTTVSGEEQHACLACHCLLFDLLLVCTRSRSLSDCVSSSTDDRERACFPFDFEALFLGSRERGPLLSGSVTAFSVGRRTRSDLWDIADQRQDSVTPN